jgi:putative sugar O-methyltransferase
MKIRARLAKIRQFFIKKNRLDEVKKRFSKEIISNSLYSEINIEKCFVDHYQKTSNKEIIDRIISAYNKSKAIQKTLPEAYQVGNEWIVVYKHYMNEIIDALENKDSDKVNTIYENFMRHDCSTGLHGLPINMVSTYVNRKITKLDKEIYLFDVVHRFAHWKKLTENKFTSKDLFMPNYGNPYGYYENNNFIRTGAEYLHYYSELIKNLIKKNENRKYIVELGGGYGGLGYFLNKNISNLTYIDFDLPENMALTAYYLMSCFPDKKVLLFGEETFDLEATERYDIIIMPNFELSKLNDNKIDLVFNSYSLAEMSTETINTYIPELVRSCKDYILHINHTRISKSLKADDFGIDENKFELISKSPALWNLGRNINMDEFEYLYQKKVR